MNLTSNTDSGRPRRLAIKLFFACFIGALAVLIASAPLYSSAPEGNKYVVTIYFGGTGLSSTWYNYKDSLPVGSWWYENISRFNEPHLLSEMHHFQIANEDEYHFKKFVNGVGAYPQCNGSPVVLGQESQRQQKNPHKDICWWWSKTVGEGKTFLKEKLDLMAPEDSMIVNLLGNSRGGISAMWFLRSTLSDESFENLEQIKKINIIAIDPVPGANTGLVEFPVFDKLPLADLDAMGGEKNFGLDPRLTSYVGIYADDERSYGFSPLVPYTYPYQTKTLLFRVRGSHETIAGSHQDDGHSVIAGLLQYSAGETSDLKSVGDIVTITAVELMNGPEWGSIAFEDELLDKIYPEGGEGEEAHKSTLATAVSTMNAVSDSRWEDMREETFFPFGLYESFYFDQILGLNCHVFDSIIGGAGLQLHDYPRCALRMFPDGYDEENEVVLLKPFEQSIIPLDGEYDIPLIGVEETTDHIWHTIRLLSQGDDDWDEVANDVDNCPLVYNPDQEDLDQDGEGNLCDPDDAVANAGPDQTLECTCPDCTPATLDGSASYDPDGDPLNFHWTAPGITFTEPYSATTSADFPLGTTVVSLDVNDGTVSDAASDTVNITIQDTIQPAVSARLVPAGDCNEDGCPFQVSCSAEDACTEGITTASFILLPEMDAPEVIFTRAASTKITVDQRRSRVTVRAPDPQALWDKVSADHGLRVENGHVLFINDGQDDPTSGQPVAYRFAGDHSLRLVTGGTALTLECRSIDRAGNMGTDHDVVPMPFE